MAITVHCPSCSTAFPVDPAKVPEEGVHARCSVCERVFPVERPAGEARPEGEAAESRDDFIVGTEDMEVEPEPLEGLVSEGEMDPSETFPPTEAEGGPETAAPAAPAEPTEEAAPGESAAPAQETPPTESSEPAAPAPRTEPPTRDDGANPFLQRDPRHRAARLARVLVSDMIMYNPDRHTRALEQGTLAEDFEEEIQKSWKEYVEQVGQEIADETTYFNEALNEILARGEDVF